MRVLIKELQKLPRGQPFDSSVLSERGISTQRVARYVTSGWLDRVAHGVYAFPGDAWTAHGAVLLLQRNVPGLHVGGKSALELHGVRHNLAPRDALVLWGDRRLNKLPGWLTSRYPARYSSARLFDWPDAELPKATITTPPGVTPGLPASVPERATLEMLYDVGTHQSLEEARNIFDGLRNLRSNVLGRLLACCTSVKAVRLLLTWSRQTQLVDVDKLVADFRVRTGSDKRWISKLPDGTLLSLNPHG